MMKKIMSLLLTVLMILSLLAGCGAQSKVRHLGTLKKYNNDDLKPTLPEEDWEDEEEQEKEEQEDLVTVYLLVSVEADGLYEETYTYDENGFIVECRMESDYGEEIDYCYYVVDEKGCPVTGVGRSYGEPYEFVFRYDSSGNILSMTYYAEEQSTILMEYTYDSRGNRLEQKDYYDDSHVSTTRFSYDQSGQLTGAKNYSAYDESVSEEWYYDAYGRLERKYTYPTEMEGDNDSFYIYDENGCIDCVTMVLDGGNSYNAYYYYMPFETTAEQAEILMKVQKDLLRIY